MKKIVSLLISLSLLNGTGGMPVFDTTSFSQLLALTEQVTTTIKLAQEQVTSLGGISSAVNETKKSAISVQQNLMNVTMNLANAIEDFRKNVNVNAMKQNLRDLGSFDPKVLNKNTGKGVFYGDIKEFVETKDKKNKDLEQAITDMERINQALGASSTKEFNKYMNLVGTREKYAELDIALNNSRIYKYAKMTNEYFESVNSGTEPTINKKLKRIEELAKSLKNESSMIQMQRLQVMHLHEMLKEMTEIGHYMAFLTAVVTSHYGNVASRNKKNLTQYNIGLSGLTDEKFKKRQERKNKREFCRKFNCTNGISWSKF